MNGQSAPGSSAGEIVVIAPRQTVHWIIAGLLAIIATVLIVRDGGPLGGAEAFGQTQMLGARGLFAFTGQLDRTKYGLWMMDVDAGTVWCYEYNPVRQKMRLVAARSFRHDRFLSDYSQDSPTPAEVEELLKQARASAVRAQNLSGDPPAIKNAESGSQPSGGDPATAGS
ncbi:MAG: hypothetical protein HUU22_02700 [Phycisphaerae bacterium]|nr:hypothetical protein [Phycisphaerae bacterium]NUQ44923.1 hypothetical protein [Phycisphaerae bacterium]